MEFLTNTSLKKIKNYPRIEKDVAQPWNGERRGKKTIRGELNNFVRLIRIVK